MYDPITNKHERLALYLEAQFDGGGTMFCNRGAETVNQGGNLVKWFFSDVVAGNTTKFLVFFGELYKRASYFGMVDIGVGLTGLENSIEFEIRNNLFLKTYYYEKSSYKRTKRVSAMLLEENPKQVASDLLMNLISAISQGKYNPFS
jgi:hypothetical protein